MGRLACLERILSALSKQRGSPSQLMRTKVLSSGSGRARTPPTLSVLAPHAGKDRPPLPFLIVTKRHAVEYKMRVPYEAVGCILVG